MSDKKKSGYMTIEATLIMPLIIMGIVFIIYIGFYLYDVSVIRQISYVAALRASEQLDFTDMEMKEYAKKQLSELKENRLLVIKTWEEKINVNNGRIKIRVSAQVAMPFQSVFLLYPGVWEIKSEAQAIKVNPVQIIWKLRGSDDS